ncbi:roadblock/LC7 domain-containing protein [Nocardiopsis kunsanensis]|uniref:hypothetical protein n=1 Tax=Nocardiopsis kunsanensis TaxID=141693 RepID=UPI0005940E40|nr:hypothetical protein [Nocardiopsis kunsanensis]
MSSQTPTVTGSGPGLLHERVRAFASEHGVDVVLLSSDGRLISLGGSIAVPSAEQIAGTAFTMISYAKRIADWTQRDGANLLSVRYTSGTLTLLAASDRAWIAVGNATSSNGASTETKHIAYQAARFTEQIRDLLPATGAMALPSPVSAEVAK